MTIIANTENNKEQFNNTTETGSPFVSVLYNKTVIADTSSLLIAGTKILEDMPKCELIIPSVVISELEDKRTHSTLGFLARQWLRLIEEIRVVDSPSLRTGATSDINPDVSIRIEPNHSSQESLPVHLRDGTFDKTILAVAKNFDNEHRTSAMARKEQEGKGIKESRQEAYSEDEDTVVLLSNDTPMRIHATLDLGLNATGYEYASVNKIKPFSGVVEVFVSSDEIQEIYSSASHRGGNYSHSLPDSVVDKVEEEAFGLGYCVVKLKLEVTHEEIGFFLFTPNGIVDVDMKESAVGIEGRTIQQTIALNYLLEGPERLPICSLGGSAGTGKTLLALAAGIDGVDQEKYEKVIVLRSLHEMGAGQEMGFLPGDSKDKMQPWAGAVYDALSAISKQKSKKSVASGKNADSHVFTVDNTLEQYKEVVEISPITYLRGRSLSNSYIIIEEAQNFSFSELLNILSRVGDGSKVVMTFDAAQVDNKFLASGDKADVWSVIDKLKKTSLFGHMTLVRTERSKVAGIASAALEGRL